MRTVGLTTATAKGNKENEAVKAASTPEKAEAKKATVKKEG